MIIQTITLTQKKNITYSFEILLVLALSIDLFTPYLIWKGMLPSAIRWGSHVAVASMIMVSILRMLGFKHIPGSFWLIIGISAIWSIVALGNGQAITTTAWGVWLLFQFPFVGLFSYVQPVWPQNLPEYLRKFSLWILGVQVFFQLLQFVTGVHPGDSLSGLFGENGTGNAALFCILVSCLFLGYWVESKRWSGLVIVLLLSVISSVLGEMKLFPVAIVLIGGFAVVLYAIRHRKPMIMFVLLFLIAVALMSFMYLYNFLVPGADEDPIQSYITNPAMLSQYLNRVEVYNLQGSTYADIGRVAAVQLGWSSLQKDLYTFIFGYGIGSRSESKTLGAAGVALTGGYLGWSVGTSLLVFMQEMGVLGLTSFFAFILWINVSMVREMRKNPFSTAFGIRVAVLMFSSLWPIWLFYAVTWTMRVPMLLYWFILGYVFAESQMPILGKSHRPH